MKEAMDVALKNGATSVELVPIAATAVASSSTAVPIFFPTTDLINRQAAAKA